MLAFAGIGYEIIDSFRRPQVRHGTAILIVLVLLFGSLNLLAVSLLGEYLMKIFEEVKRRPRFIRRGSSHAGKVHRSATELARFVAERKAARRSTELRGRQ